MTPDACHAIVVHGAGSDTPLTKKAKSAPTKAQLRTAINAFLAGANLEELSRKKVCGALSQYRDQARS